MKLVAVSMLVIFLVALLAIRQAGNQAADQAFALGGWISAHIVRRIQVAHRLADNLAEGKLNVVAELDGSDELSNLAGALNRTATQCDFRLSYEISYKRKAGNVTTDLLS